MLYPDPKRVRTHKLTMRLDEYEHQLLVSLANYQGEQISTLIRDLVLREAQQVISLGHESSLQQMPL